MRVRTGVVASKGLVTKASMSAALLVAIGLLLVSVHGHYPIQKWLFWRYLGYWFAAGVFLISSVTFGDWAVAKVLGRRLERAEHLVMACAVGTLGFGLGVFCAGILRLLGAPFFFLFPALLAVPFVGAFWRAHRSWILGPFTRSGSIPRALLVTLPIGALLMALAYIPVITPNNISYDARWYHLPIAEHYAAAGRITRFDEGWVLGAYPQLGSLFYTWAMLMPFGVYFDRVLLCAHLEWVLFVATVASVPALVRALAPGLSGRGAGLVMFLFPGMLLYDSSLGAGGDHIVAAYAPALWIALLRAWPKLDARPMALFALVLAATSLTKYTAALLVVPVLAALGVRALWLLGKALHRRPVRLAPWLVAMAVFGVVFCVATAPHWLKNAVFYRDPLFPTLHQRVQPDPWVPEAKVHYDFLVQKTLASAPRSLRGVQETLSAAVTFSFVPHDWPNFHRNVPVFGMLFTLSWLILPFLRSWRLVGLGVAVEIGVLFWYWTHHWDRFLQSLLPWMTGVTAAVLALCWRQGGIVRWLAVALATLQGIWGSDVPFFPTHALLGDTPYRDAIRLAATGHQQKYEERFVVSHHETIGRALPRDAKVLIHNEHLHHGLERMAVNDRPQFQTGLSYAQLGSPRAVHDKLRSFGVTHVLVPPEPSDIEVDSVAANLVFWDFFRNHTQNHRPFGGHELAELKPEPPPAPPKTDVLVTYLGCERSKRYASGLYRLGQMTALYDGPYPAPIERENDKKGGNGSAKALLERSDYAVVDQCRGRVPSLTEFEQIYRRLDMTLYKRRTPKS